MCIESIVACLLCMGWESVICVWPRKRGLYNAHHTACTIMLVVVPSTETQLAFAFSSADSRNCYMIVLPAPK